MLNTPHRLTAFAQGRRAIESHVATGTAVIPLLRTAVDVPQGRRRTPAQSDWRQRRPITTHNGDAVMNRRHFMRYAAPLAALLASGMTNVAQAQAQSFPPNKPVTLMVGF